MDANRRPRLARFSLIAATLLTWACGDPATAPIAEEMSRPSLAESEAGSVAAPVAVLERRVALAEEERVSRTIGLLGGVVVLPEAGLSVLVPPGALTAPTTITVIAPAGRLVGYHFLPEGQSFSLPLVVRQSLLGTEAVSALGSGQHLVAAHFDGELTPVVDALELLTLDVLGPLGVFRVEHFSGYVIGTN